MQKNQNGYVKPLWNRNQGGIREAIANIRVAESKLIRVSLRIEQLLAKRFGQYENARLQVDRYSRRIIPKADEAVQIALKAYGAGELSVSDVLNAQRALLRASLRRLAAQQELRATYIEMRGFMLTGSLSGGNDA